MNWMDMSLRDFESALASSDATPGGGTAAAVALGQAAALTQMVCKITLGKEKWQAGWASAQLAEQVAGKVIQRAGVLAKEDSDAFDLVVSAFKLPKATEGDKEKRRKAIRSGTLKAAEVPLETAELGMSLLSVLEELALHGNANAASDVGVASLLASASVKGALFNVEINVASLPEPMAAPVVLASKGMREQCSEISRRVMHAVHDRIQS